jgi:ribonuclease Z
VHEFDGGRRISACFSAANAFRPEPVENAPSEGVLVDEPSFTVRAAILDHRIPCLAFSLEEKSRLNIRRDVLHAMGLRGGPWLDELKRMLREKLPESTSMEIPEKNGGRNRLTLKEWRAALVLETKGQKIVYVVDNLFNSENVEKVISLAQQADLFYCESTFAKTDEDRAKETYHLTAPQAGNLARMAQVRHLIPFHFSPRYQAEPNRLLEEALQAFAKG